MWPEVSSTDQNEQRALESHRKSRALSTAVKCPDQVGAGEPSVGQGQQTGSKMSESGTEGFCGIQGSWRDTDLWRSRKQFREAELQLPQILRGRTQCTPGKGILKPQAQRRRGSKRTRKAHLGMSSREKKHVVSVCVGRK